MSEIIYDLSFITDVAKGNKDFIKSLIEVFISNTPPIAAEMRDAYDAKDWDRLAKLAHKLKSTIDTMGLITIKDDIRFIETNAKAVAELATINEKIDKVKTVVDNCVTKLQLEPVFN